METGTYLDDLPEQYRPKPAPEAPKPEGPAAVTGTYLDDLPEQYRPRQAKDDTPEEKLRIAKAVAANTPEDVFHFAARTAFPFVTTAANAATGEAYGAAKRRIQTGVGKDEDYRKVAEYEALQERDAKDNQTWAGAALHTGAGVLRMAGEAEMGGAILGAAGMAPTGGGMLGAAGRLGVKTAAAPSMWADQWQANNVQAGRDPHDVRGLPDAFALGMAQMAIIGSLGDLGHAAAPGGTVAAFATRSAVRGAVGFGEAQAADLAHGLVKDQVRKVLPDWVSRETSYGTIGDLLTGKKKGGDALREATMTALTFAALGTVHEGAEPGPVPEGQRLLPPPTPEAPQGLPYEPAAPAAGPQPGPQPGPKPNQGPQPGTRPGAGRFRPTGEGVPKGIVDAYNDALRHFFERGWSRDRAGQKLSEVGDRLKTALRDNPDLTREQAQALFANDPDGPLKDLGMAFASALKSENPAAPGNAPESPQAAAPGGLGREPNEPLPAPGQARQELPAPEQPQATPSNPEQPAETPPEFQAGQKTAWHEKYAELRGKGLSHEKAAGLADLTHEAGQTWVHSGTKLEGAEKDTFKANGQTYRIDPRFWDAQTDLGGEHGGVRLGVKDTSGKEVATVAFLRNADGTWYASGLKAEEGHRGVARALYDHMTEAGQSIVPSKEGQSAEGKDFWRKNAERATGQKEPAKPETASKPPEETAAERAARRLENQRRKQKGLAPIQAPTQAAPARAEAPAAPARAPKMAWKDLPDQAKENFRDMLYRAGATRMAQQLLRGETPGDLPPREPVGPKKSWQEQAMDSQAATVGRLIKTKSANADAGVRKLERMAKGRGISDEELNKLVPGLAEYRADLDHRDAGHNLQPAARQWVDKAAADGLDPANVRSVAEEYQKDESARTEERNDLLKELRRRLQGKANLVHLERYAEPDQIPYLDTIAQEYFDNNPAFFGHDPHSAPQKLFDMLKEGNREKPTQAEAYERAYHTVDQMRKYSEPTPEEIGEVNDALKQAGEQPLTPEDLADVQAEALAEATGAEADTSFDFGANAGPESAIERARHNASEGADLTNAQPLDSRQAWNLKNYGRELVNQGLDEPPTNRPAVEKELRRIGAKLKDGEWKLDVELTGKDVNGWPQSGTISYDLSPFFEDKGFQQWNNKAEPEFKSRPFPVESGVSPEIEAVTKMFPTSDAELAALNRATTGKMEPGDAEMLEAWAANNNRLMDLAKRFAQDESGSANLDVLRDVAKSVLARLKAAAVHLSYSMKELAGKMAPRTTSMSRLAGEALSRFNAARAFVREAAPYYIDRVVGKDVTPEQRKLWGATFQEMRHRYAKQALRQAGKNDAADQVVSLVGQSWSPLKTEADFIRTLQDGQFKAFLNRWRTVFVPEMDSLYRAGQGLDENDPIDALTQIPGMPMNAKAVRQGEGEGFGGGGKGNLKNLRTRKDPFAEAASLAADEYDTDVASIIENTLNKRVQSARKAEFYRTAVSEGVGRWARPGVKDEAWKEIPATTPPRGTQASQPGDVFYAKSEIYDEVRRALDVDQPIESKTFKAIAKAVTMGALASTAEATYHTKNLLTFLTKPGVSLADVVKNAHAVLTGDMDARSRLMELARIGALKEHGLETGTLWQAATDIAAAGGATLDPNHPLSRYDPTLWVGKFLDTVDRTMRLTADDAFERMKAKGLVEGSETNKRDFINQLGQYNRKAQHRMVAFLRDSGLGPFATAGTNYYLQGLSALTMSPGVKATSPEAAVRLRAEMLGKTAAVLGVVGLMNFLMWGRIDGSDDTPIGAIKVGEDKKLGRTAYYDLTAFTGLTRGAREVGLLATAEGARKGKPLAKTTDKAVENAVESAMHPLAGPPVQFLYTAYTGKTTSGFQVAEKAATGEPQTWENVKAALAQANPAYAALTGAEHPKSEVPADEKAMKLLGPFGVKYRYAPGRKPPLKKK